MKRLLTLLFLLASFFSIGQANINLLPASNGNPSTLYTGCASSVFNDDGGNVNYSNNFNGVAVFCPIVTTDRMVLDFRVLDIAVNDVLTIYDGDSIAAPLIATITNTNVAPGVFQASATNPTGCLTVRFVSDGSGNASGWRAARSCFNPCQTITTNITTIPPIDADGILRICQGDSVRFDGQATFSTDGTGATYEWDLANGAGFNLGQVQVENYATTGIYQTKLRVTDAIGCNDREEIDLVVQVSSDPDFTGTMAADTRLCFGESTTLTGVATPQEFLIPVSPPVTGRTFLPDGSGVSYTTCIDVDLFAPGAVITNASDILNIFLNMEHSFLGDLQVTISAPNGSSVDLHSNGGGSTFLGVPIDIDGDRTPGVGFDYVFTESATQTWLQASTGNQTIPAGDYLPVDPYSNFIGSPLNGQWCITVTDNLQFDNGYIFFWGLNFNPSIIPSDLSFTPVIVNEGWQASPDITATVGNTVTVTPSTAGQNCYTYEMVDNHGCTYTEQVCIDVAPEILSAAPNDIVECNTTGAAITVDLTVNDAVILNGLIPVNHIVTYHESMTDAENNINEIANPTAYTITSIPQTIYTSVTALANVFICNVVDSFVVDIIDLAALNIPDFEQCGAIVNFDLDAYVAMFLSGGGSGASNFTISYHTSLLDAQNNVNPIMNPNMYNLPAGTVTIYIRIVSTTDPGCNSVNPFSITAAAIPVANVAMDMIVCDDLTNNGVEDFVLSNQDVVILGGQNATVTYHLTQLDAVNGVAPLNTTLYQNMSNPQTVYARVTDNTSLMCSSTTMFDLIVNRRAVFTTINDMIVCDDATNDGFAQFDLTTQSTDILGAQIVTDNTITFYVSQADADAGINEIVNPMTYTNVTTGTETIFVRIENNNATDCADFGSFDLIINATPVANPVMDVVLCDDSSNDGVDNFQLDSYSPQVLLTQDPALFMVSYYESQLDADAGVNALSGSSFTNTSNPQTIYTRIENVSNALCYNTITFDLIINELSVANAPDIVLCDDPSGNGFELFDLTQNDVAILNGLNPADYTVVYSNASGVITSPYTNTTNPETITVTLQNILTTCSDTTTFDLIVSPVPATVASFTIEECDADGDGVATFSLSDGDSQIINGQSGTSVTYHESTGDALSGLNSLDTANYDNTTSPQIIYYRIEFTGSGCFSIGDIVIEPVDAPIAVVPTALEACDDGTGNATIDVSTVSAQVTTGQLGSTVIYYLNQVDADNQVNGITSSFTYSSNTTLIARVDDDNTDCFSFTTLDVVFNPLPAPSLLDQYVLCLDENDNLVNGPVTLNTNLNDIDYSYEWTLNGGPITASTASIDVSEGGDYEVIATRISTGCSNAVSTNVRVSSIPDVYDIDITTNPFDKEHQVIVTAQGPDQYWYRLDDGPYVNNGRFNNVSPGPHTVTIAERSGCGEIVEDIFVFGYPDYFTPNGDGIHDTWNIVGGDLLPGTVLYIFDRYGKLIKQIDVDGIGWDGNYNGQPLPSTDYWFKIEYAFDGEQREANGHFAMKR